MKQIGAVAKMAGGGGDFDIIGIGQLTASSRGKVMDQPEGLSHGILEVSSVFRHV